MCDFDEVFVKKTDYLIDNELKSFYKNEVETLHFEPMSEDKKSIKSDFSHVSSDLNTSLKEYKIRMQY